GDPVAVVRRADLVAAHDPWAALDLYDRGCALGDPGAYEGLARLADEGRGLSKDAARAERFRESGRYTRDKLRLYDPSWRLTDRRPCSGSPTPPMVRRS